MIRIAWLQFRMQVLMASIGLAVIAVFLAITGPHLADLYAASGLKTCHNHGDCTRLSSDYLGRVKADSIYPALYFLGIGATIATPGLIGIFWGAPLVSREFETGTFRLAWSQVSPKRWLAVKVALIGAVAVAVTGLLSFMMMWWSSPVFRSGVSPGDLSYLDRFSPLLFVASGVTPVGYAAFAFVLGVIIGALSRRVVPAMALTLLIFTVVQLVVPNFVRPYYPIRPARIAAPVSAQFLDANVVLINNGEITLPLNEPGALVNVSGALVLSNEAVTRTGQQYVLPSSDCQTGTVDQCMALIASQDLHQLVTYQPSNHYWIFQWFETAMFLILSLLLAGIGIWSTRPDRSLTIPRHKPAVSGLGEE